ncbi:MAG: hypothetical protein ACRDPY_15300 [Streptosporangiaceae bacterium]
MTYQPPGGQPGPRQQQPWPRYQENPPQPQYGQQQPYQQQWQQPYPAPAPQPFPRRAVTKRPLSLTETCFHAGMTFLTCGLWGFVWWRRVRNRRAITTFR